MIGARILQDFTFVSARTLSSSFHPLISSSIMSDDSEGGAPEYPGSGRRRPRSREENALRLGPRKRPSVTQFLWMVSIVNARISFFPGSQLSHRSPCSLWKTFWSNRACYVQYPYIAKEWNGVPRNCRGRMCRCVVRHRQVYISLYP
jgi:hypothetical protein